jgi:hypothetical protein
MRMLEFKTSEKNLENCIISRNNELKFELKDEKKKFVGDRANKELSKKLI